MVKFIYLLFALTLGTLFSTTASASKNQIDCLAKVMYFEARGGSDKDRLNVAHTVLNRTQHNKFPDSVCTVIADRKHVIQFPWYYNKPIVRDYKTYEELRNLATRVYRTHVTGTRYDPTRGSLFFHAKTINPKWNYKRLRVDDNLHIFYTTS